MSQANAIVMYESRLLLNRIIKGMNVRVCDLPKSVKRELEHLLWVRNDESDAEDLKECLADNCKVVRQAIATWIKETNYVKPAKEESADE